MSAPVLIRPGSSTGNLAGAQRPRFWTAPPRHREPDPDCGACANNDYPGLGCGEYQSSDLLSWAPEFGYDLDDWQSWYLTESCGTKPDGRWAAFECMLVAPRQNGKNNHAMHTPIYTDRGWQTFATIRAGDSVIGSDGRFTQVVAVTSVFPEDVCYAVTFTDGARYVVGQDHLWPVSYRGGPWQVRKTRDLARSVGGRRPSNGRMEYNWRVRCDTVVQSPRADLLVDPYLLGYWLGDGDKYAAVLFTAKTDRSWVESAIASAGGTVTVVREHPDTGVQEISFRLGPVRSQYGFNARLRALGIFGAKRIPEQYLTAAPDQRLALLRGLMDSDGSIAITNKSPQAEWTSSDPGLAEDFMRLARSLGIRVTPKIGKTSCNGKRHKDRTRFLWTPAFNPFALPRKAERWRPPVSRRHELMSITSIQEVPSVPTRCITIAAQDGVYLVGKLFTPTHNSSLEVRELGGMYVFGERMIIHTAHEFKACQEHFRRVRDTVTAYDELRRRVKSITTSHGDEAIELRPVATLIFGSAGTMIRRKIGTRLRFLARSRGSGRAFTADCVVYDEAMILSDEVVGASLPTLSAIPNPQVIYTGSAGYKDSVQLGSVRRRVQRGDPSLMGAEWSIIPHADTCPRDELRGRKANRYIICGLHDDRDDPRSWAKANPALGARISAEHVAHEMEAMVASPHIFDRERLGVGDWPADEEAWAVISREHWEACVMPDPGGATRPVAFAFDVDPDMLSACIAAAWYRPGKASPGRAEIEIAAMTMAANGPLHPGSRLNMGEPDRPVVEIPQGCHREGFAWVVPRLLELRRAWRPIAVAAPRNGPAAGLIDEAENVGIEIMKMSSADEAAAFSLIVKSVRGGDANGTPAPRLVHLGRDLAPGLWQAVATADTRDVGDGGQAWSRRDSESDITPVTSATAALWALNKKRRNYDWRKSVR